MCSFVMRVAAECDARTGNRSVNNVLLMNFAKAVRRMKWD